MSIGNIDNEKMFFPRTIFSKCKHSTIFLSNIANTDQRIANTNIIAQYYFCYELIVEITRIDISWYSKNIILTKGKPKKDNLCVENR